MRAQCFHSPLPPLSEYALSAVSDSQPSPQATEQPLSTRVTGNDTANHDLRRDTEMDLAHTFYHYKDGYYLTLDSVGF